MQPALLLENVRTSALWRVGRNLECFQKLEVALKLLIPVAQGAGTIAQIETQIRERRREAKKASLGTLAKSYERQMLSGPQIEQEPEVGEDILISFSSSIDAPPEVLKEMKSQWRRLVRERNQLVHSTLLAYNLESIKGCIALSEHLDAQYERGQKLLDRLAHHQECRSLAVSAFLQLIESDQLSNPVFSPTEDA